LNQHQQEPQPVQDAISSDAFRVLSLEQEMEILQEQVESLKRVLCSKDELVQQLQQQLEDAQQDMDYINQELSSLFQSQRLTLKEAKDIARTLVASQQPTAQSFAQLLNQIFGSSIPAWELEQKPRLIPCINTEIEKFPQISIDVKVELNKLGTQRIAFQAMSTELKTLCHQLKAQARTLRQFSQALKTKSQLLIQNRSAIQRNPIINPLTKDTNCDMRGG
jgi:hypothetical protein